MTFYQSKANLYNLRQGGNMTNYEYLQRFQNLVDLTIAYHGQLHDQAILDIATEQFQAWASYSALTAE